MHIGFSPSLSSTVDQQYARDMPVASDSSGSSIDTYARDVCFILRTIVVPFAVSGSDTDGVTDTCGVSMTMTDPTAASANNMQTNNATFVIDVCAIGSAVTVVMSTLKYMKDWAATANDGIVPHLRLCLYRPVLLVPLEHDTLASNGSTTSEVQKLCSGTCVQWTRSKASISDRERYCRNGIISQTPTRSL